MQRWVERTRVALSVLTVLAAAGWLSLTDRGNHAVRYLAHAASQGQFAWLLVALLTQTLATLISGAVAHYYFDAGAVTMRLPRFLVLHVYQTSRTLVLPGGAVARSNPLQEALATRHSKRRVTVVSLLASVQTLSVLGIVLTLASMWLEFRHRQGGLLTVAELLAELLGLAVVVWLVGYPGPTVRFLSRLQWAQRRFPRRHDELVSLLAELHKVNITGRKWLLLLLLTTLSFTAELLTFAACFRALGIPASLPRVLVGYLALQTALTFPVTPAGLLVVEALVAAALHQTHLSWSHAIAITVIHRLVTTPYLIALGAIAARRPWVRELTETPTK